MPPVLFSFISPGELWPGRSVSYDEVAGMASQFNRRAALLLVGQINFLLAAANVSLQKTGDTQPLRDVQRWLHEGLLSRDLADRVRRLVGSSLGDRLILHRSQLLFAIRLIATHSREKDGRQIKTEEDRHAFCEFLLLVGGLYDAPAVREGNQALWVATEIAPLCETENPPDLLRSWPRLVDFFGKRLPDTASDPIELERLERVALFASGFSALDWLDLSFMLFSHWSAIDPKSALSDPERAFLDAGKDYPQVASSTVLRQVMDALAVSLDELPSQLRIDAFSRKELFDLTPFRVKPLWRISDDLLFCPDPVMLMDRLGPHAFWAVQNALDTAERRRAFSKLWGDAFEDYCADKLAIVFRAKRWLYHRRLVGERTGDELFDAVATRDGTALVFEIKGTFITTADKCAGVPHRFFRGLSRKFGNVKHGGVYQLVRGIRRVWFDRFEFGPIARSSETKDIFPILVVQDPAVECGPVSRVLSDRCAVAIRRAARKARKPPKVWPLTVMSVEDLELLAAAVHVSGARLDAFLKGYHRAHPSRIVALNDFASQRLADYFGPPERAYGVLQDEFSRLTGGTLERFKAGDYGGPTIGATDPILPTDPSGTA